MRCGGQKNNRKDRTSRRSPGFFTKLLPLQKRDSLLPPSPAEEKKTAPLAKVVRDLERLMDLHGWHRDPHLTIDRLAQYLFTNKHYLSQAIRTHTGEGFLPYLYRLRVREAQTLMREEPDLRLTQIAFRSGFRSLDQFCKAFQAQTGQSVEQWRKTALTKQT